MTNIEDQRVYEGRADYIDDTDLINWTVESEHFEPVQKKLHGSGAVLIAGPRGAGKTHQMKVAYNTCHKDQRKPLAVYVTYGKYYHLEPLLKKQPNAIRIFHTWVLGKILLSCIDLIESIGDHDEEALREYFEKKEDLADFVAALEKGNQANSHEYWMEKLTILRITMFLEDLAEYFKRNHIVLLLDDAALTLTPDYMVEFFNVFRGLRSKKISPKASVYPGTTEYGPGFHLGQDAELVNIWFNLEDKDLNYIDFISNLVEKRLPEIKETISPEFIDLFKYASFGIPRLFINLVRSFQEMRGSNVQAKFNRVIEIQATLIETEYLSLSRKMSRYKSIIETGYDFFIKILDDVILENKKLLNNGSSNEKQVKIGLQEVDGLQFSRMLKFLNEAGLLYDLGPVTHGGRDGRKYDRYIPHFLFLLQKRAFSTGKGFDAGKTLTAIRRKQTKHALRRSFSTLLSTEQYQKVKLDLPVCKNCSTPRLTEGQRFCHHCGRELVDKSTFEMCMQIHLEELPLTPGIKRRLGEIQVNTIGDLYSSQSPGSDLQKAPYLGPKRSRNIIDVVNGIVEEYLT